MALVLLACSLSVTSGCAGPWLGGKSCCCCHRNPAIPDRFPLGSVNRAHYHAMQTNGEAADFILHRNDFVGETAELTPNGKDHVLEIAARMRSAPFPVLVERSEHNSNPQLDADRRVTVASVLGDLGNGDADQRTIVATPYGRGITSMEGQIDYGHFLFNGRGGFGNNLFGGFGGGFSGGFGGGIAGGIGGGSFGFGR
jgi:hypothetical protein